MGREAFDSGGRACDAGCRHHRAPAAWRRGQGRGRARSERLPRRAPRPVIRKLLAAGVAVVVLAAGLGAYVILRPGSGAREVIIPRGASTSEIGQILDREGVIGSDALFGLAARLRRLDGRIQAGRYELRSGMGILSALNALAGGPIEKGSGVTVPEGFSLRQVSERVGRNTKITAADFLAAASNGSVRGYIHPS